MTAATNSTATSADSASAVTLPQLPLAKRAWGIWEKVLLLAVVLACAVAVSPHPADPDLWGHVQYGRDAIAEGIPATTTYSYTANGYRWINHENLSELLLAVGADTVGPIGLLIIKCLLGVAVICAMIRLAVRGGAGLVAVSVTALLVAVNLSYHWSARPQLMSFLCFTALVLLLNWCFAGWSGKWNLPLIQRWEKQPIEPLQYDIARLRLLWLAPLILMIWANSHGGFVAGLCIFIAYMGCRSIEALACKGRAGWGLVARFTMMSAAAVLATLINPYGPGLHLWLIHSLGTPRPEIMEWHPPDLASSLAIPFWLIVSTFALTLLATRKSHDFTRLVLLAITLWQALEHQRHMPFFAILFGFWMPLHIESVLSRFKKQNAEEVPFGQGLSLPLRWAFGIGLAGAFALLGSKLAHRLGDMPVDRSVYPVAAMQYMADQNLQGKLVVTYNWAQYAIAAFRPQSAQEEGLKVAFDGRFRTCYPQEIVDMHFDFVLGKPVPGSRRRSKKSPPLNPHRVLEFGQPNVVLISRHQPQSTLTMEQNKKTWTLLYQDELAQVWGRSSLYNDPSLPTYIPPQARNISDAPQTGVVTWPALPQRSRAGIHSTAAL